MGNFRVSTLLPALLLLAIGASAQDDQTIRIETNLVSIGVAVQDRNGRYINGLKKEQFEVLDNNIRQKIEVFSNESEPVSYGFIYDLHPTTSDRTKAVLDSLKQFTSQLSSDDDFFSIVFNERGSLTLDFIPSVDQVEKHLSLEERNKPNSLYDAVFLAGEKVRERKNGKKTLIIISDGEDHFSHHSFSELNRQLKSFNVQIYAVLFDDRKRWGYSDIFVDRRPTILDIDDSRLNRAAIEDLSKSSGGRTESPLLNTGRELLAILGRISATIRQQYSIAFYPRETDDKWHKIKVKVKTTGNSKLNLSYRRGYQSSGLKKTDAGH